MKFWISMVFGVYENGKRIGSRYATRHFSCDDENDIDNLFEIAIIGRKTEIQEKVELEFGSKFQIFLVSHSIIKL